MRSRLRLAALFALAAASVLPACGESPADPSSTPAPGLGPGASLEGRRPFPSDNPWNGSGWYISGAPDRRWDDDALGTLKTVPSAAFEVFRMEGLVTP